MLRQNTDRINTKTQGVTANEELSPPASTNASTNFDIQQELNHLEDIIVYSPRIPFSGRLFVDEDQFLDQLDFIRLNLPSAFAEAENIVRQKEDILMQAEQYAQEIIEAAEQRAMQILDEIGIVRQAKQEAEALRKQVQSECEAAQQQTIAEIEQLRRQTQQEIEEMRRQALAECAAISADADEYADRVLQSLESNLMDMLRVIQNGRQHLQRDAQPPVA